MLLQYSRVIRTSNDLMLDGNLQVIQAYNARSFDFL